MEGEAGETGETRVEAAVVEVMVVEALVVVTELATISQRHPRQTKAVSCC